MATPRRSFGFAAAALLSVTLGAQTPRPVRPSGLVMGVVVDSLSGKPVAGAVVALGSAKVKADADGRFVFADLPSDNYSVDASAPGYLDGAYGRQLPDGPAAALSLGADERIGNLRIAVFKCAAISGSVLDEAGAPVVGAEVEALAKSWLGGREVLTRAGSTTTDDRGAYRFGALGTGAFLVAVNAPTLPVVRDNHHYAYAVHYFPGITAIDQATAVALAVGEDRTGVDIFLGLSAAVRVSGILHTSSGPVTGLVTLSTTGEALTAGAALRTAEITSEPDGRFTMLAVPSGSYVTRSLVRPPPLRTEDSTAPTRLMWASTPVAVDDTDVTGVDVLLRPGFRIAGRAVFESATGTRPPAYDLMRRINGGLESLDVDLAPLGDAGALTLDTGGSFLSKELPPGRYFIRLDNVPAGWSLKAIKQSGRDVSNAPIRLDSDISGVTLVFTDRPADLAGYVRSSTGVLEGATVLVFPRDRGAWIDFGRRPLGLRATRSSRDGSFHFIGLPAGDYYLIALEDASAADWQQAKRLEVLSRSATTVTVADGAKQTFDLRPAAIR